MSEKDNKMMGEPGSEISCPLFLSEEEIIERLTSEINEAASVEEKAAKAQDLMDEIEVFLSCEEYDDKNVGCKNCRVISELRKKAAELVVKARKLPHK
ncbi:hypothetical protein [Candidatus Oleimmundimicrobium sp.]|uniref:hypothetical protein n=1 Tax=Candidatus Oleimmundimicrobium sp. TaxID=3060597 RepID=UPI0027160FDC|nr:hypothetical protein [Candidatus Oleimmundimicrobium sp.]MDO8885539.1 hypothetical protein [Candidatus Oleimmundimicrobium sp.]